ncbi:MAG: tRNA uridine-5-carboxymethylaminomethyl(34) synthesis GTPase MnmE, partial [Desulfuromonadales bacterium]
ILNKTDLNQQFIFPDQTCCSELIRISAVSGDGLELLKKTVREQFLHSTTLDSREAVSLSRSRHRDALVSAAQSLQQFTYNLRDRNLEILALDLRGALNAVGSVTGQTATDEVLDRIFSSFCIGK